MAVMAVRRSSLLSIVFTFTALFGNVFGSEEMIVTHSPAYLSWQPGETIRASQLADVMSTIQGFTTIKSFEWSGLRTGNPFQRPEAIVIFEIEGFRELNLDISGKKFPLECDVEPGWPYQQIADRTYIRFPDENPILVELANDDSIYAVKSQYPALLKSLPDHPSDLEEIALSENSINYGLVESLNISMIPDLKFLMDTQFLAESAKMIVKHSKMVHDGVPDVFWFHITGLQELLSIYSPNSPQIKEALEILKKTLDLVRTAFIAAYDGNLVQVVLAVDYQTGYSVRHGRSLLESTEGPPLPQKRYNLAGSYDPNYPAIFNIILFTMLVFGLSVFAITLGIWHMDPGRDTVIYRMTNTRMKKEQ